MALKKGKPNPLNYFEMRKVNFASPHFKYTWVMKFSPILLRSIDHWIEYNLNNRYYIGQDISLDHNNTIIYTTKIGFETEKELSFFTIACPFLNDR